MVDLPVFTVWATAGICLLLVRLLTPIMATIPSCQDVVCNLRRLALEVTVPDAEGEDKK